MRDEVDEKTEDEMNLELNKFEKIKSTDYGQAEWKLTWDGTRGEEEMAEQKRGKKMNLMGIVKFIESGTYYW